MSKDPRKKTPAQDRNLPVDLIPLGRAPTRPIKSSIKLEGQSSKGSGSSINNASTSTPSAPTLLDASPSQPYLEPTHDNTPAPIQKKIRINTTATGSNSAPSTPPRGIKNEDGYLKSAMRKVPAQFNRTKSLWSLTQNVKIEQDSLVNVRQVDEEVHNTFSQTSWQNPPPLHHIRAALQYLKLNALKPDPVITSGLLRLGKAMPDLLREQTISTMMIWMLRPEFTHSFKIRTNGVVVFLVCALLHLAWEDVEDWPTDFVMAYLEDALGERSWCANAETKQFVGNILTAFRIDDPLEESGDIKFDQVRVDEKSNASAFMATIDINEYTSALSIRKRYKDPTIKANIKHVTLQTMWDHLPMCIGVSAVDASVRSLIKVMMATCRWVEVRLKAMSCMEFWLGSFTKIAKPLLRMILRQISSQETMSREDLETWTMLLDFRYKGRAHQVEAVKEELRVALIGMAGQELIRSGLKHIMASELNPNELKNPYHLDLMDLFLEGIPEKPAVEFGQLVQGCTIEAAIQMSSSSSGPAGMIVVPNPQLAPVVVVVKRWIRHLGKRSSSWNADVVVGLLMDQDGKSFARLALKQEDHGHHARSNKSVSTLWIQVLTDIVCYVMMATAIDAREMEEIRMSKFSISHGHAFVLRWIQGMMEKDSTSWSSASGQEEGQEQEGDRDLCKTPFGMVPVEVLRACIGRLLFLDPPQSYAMDAASQDFDTTLIYRVVENGLPLTEMGLMALLEMHLPPKMLLGLVGEYVSRATDLARFYTDSLVTKNPDVVVKLFHLSRFCETGNTQVQKMADEIPLAWSQSFWTCALIVTMLASCNPRILALIVWDSMPVIRMLLEFCISQHYTFPPPNYTSRSEPSAERLLRLGIQAEQKDRDLVLAWEKEALIVQGLWGQDKDGQPRQGLLPAQESEYVGWLMRLDFGPTQPARAPPPEVMQQLRSMNERYGLGMKLAGSRDPDYLGRMVGSQDDAAWVDRLLRDVPEILNALPASTLCARFCRSVNTFAGTGDSSSVESAGGGAAAVAAVEPVAVDSNVRRKLLGYLEAVREERTGQHPLHHPALDPMSRFQEVRDIFEYFLARLGSTRSSLIEVNETKTALEALFRGGAAAAGSSGNSGLDLKWPLVLVQAVMKTPGTGFMSKVLGWIEGFVMKEDDEQWIGSCLQFLIRAANAAATSAAASGSKTGNGVDVDGVAGGIGLEPILLTLAKVLTRRLFVWDWFVQEHKDSAQRLLVKQLEQYFAKSNLSVAEQKLLQQDQEKEKEKGKDIGEDVVMGEEEEEDIEMDSGSAGETSAEVVGTLSSSRRVQLRLSNGEGFKTFPEIIRLVLMVLSVMDLANKHAEKSLWYRIFGPIPTGANDSDSTSLEPKRLTNGQPLLTWEAFSVVPKTETMLRMRLVRSKEREVVKASMDGLKIVQVLEVVKDGFGMEVEAAQVVHRALIECLKKEGTVSGVGVQGGLVPVYLDAATSRRILLLLEYYADQGGEASQEAIELFKARFALGETNSLSSASSSSSSSLPSASAGLARKEMLASLPDFFHMASINS